MATYNEESIEKSLEALRDGIRGMGREQFVFAGMFAASAVVYLERDDFIEAAKELSARFKQEAGLCAAGVKEDILKDVEIREAFVQGAKTMWSRYNEDDLIRAHLQTEDHIETFSGNLGSSADLGVQAVRRRRLGVEFE